MFPILPAANYRPFAMTVGHAPVGFRPFLPLYGPLVVAGPPQQVLPEAQAIAAELAKMPPDKQQAYIGVLVQKAREGDKEAKVLLQQLAALPTMLQKAAEQPDIPVAQIAQQVAQLIPGTQPAFLLNEAIKMATGGKLDPIGRQLGVMKLIFEGKIGKALEAYGEYLLDAVKNVVMIPIEAIKDIVRVFQGKHATGPLGIILNPLVDIGNAIGDFFRGIFGGGPCEWTKKSGCGIGIRAWDGLAVSLGGRCCNPQPTGLGVIFTKHGPGYKEFPGPATEARAGDYVAIDSKRAAELPPLYAGYVNPGAEIRGDTSGLIVPPDFSVMAWDGEYFTGKMKEYGPGAHNTQGFNIRSLKIRGPWTIWDFRNGQELAFRKAGWVTSFMPRNPTKEEVLALVVGDPNRLPIPTSFNDPVLPWTSTWNPEWATNLERLGIFTAPPTQELLHELNIDPRDIASSKLVAQWLAANSSNPITGEPPVSDTKSTWGASGQFGAPIPIPGVSGPPGVSDPIAIRDALENPATTPEERKRLTALLASMLGQAVSGRRVLWAQPLPPHAPRQPERVGW